LFTNSLLDRGLIAHPVAIEVHPSRGKRPTKSAKDALWPLDAHGQIRKGVAVVTWFCPLLLLHFSHLTSTGNEISVPAKTSKITEKPILCRLSVGDGYRQERPNRYPLWTGGTIKPCSEKLASIAGLRTPGVGLSLHYLRNQVLIENILMNRADDLDCVGSGVRVWRRGNLLPQLAQQAFHAFLASDCAE
jgi:hypothetical protein